MRQLAELIPISDARSQLGPIAVPDPSTSRAQSATLLPLPRWRGKLLQFEHFDEAYLKRLRDGDFRTQSHFVEYFTQLIHMKLRSRLRSPQAIEDNRQETFARFFAALHADKIRQPDRLGPYVIAMCNNVLLEQWRGEQRDTPIEEDQDFAYEGASPHDAAAAKQVERKVREVIEKLPGRDARLLRALFFEERDKDEICREFGVDREYLRVLLHRAKKAFKSFYFND
jgi:RNA polymerase sigma-70 factor (ECF subfamily)